MNCPGDEAKYIMSVEDTYYASWSSSDEPLPNKEKETRVLYSHDSRFYYSNVASALSRTGREKSSQTFNSPLPCN